MPQAKPSQGSSRAVDSLSDNNPRVLTENQRIERRADGSVWLVETIIKTDPKALGPDSTERRVDSPRDSDHEAKGGLVWWKPLLAKQEAAAAKEAASKSTPSKTKE